MNAAQQPAAEDMPIPPRYWWLKRIVLASGVLLLLLLALRLWWGYEAHRRLQAEIDRIIAAGEPIYPEDFDSEQHVPDDENAATLYLSAGSSVAYQAIRDLSEDPLSWRDRFAEIATLVQNHMPELKKARAARDRTEVKWHIRYASPVMDTLLPNLHEQAALSKLLSLTAWYYHENGDEVSASEALLDALAHGKAMEQDRFLIVHLQTARNIILLSLTIESVIPTLGVSTTSHQRAGPRTAVSEELVRQIITALLDEKSAAEALVRGMLEVRMVALDAVHHVLRGKTSVADFLETFDAARSYWGPVESRLYSPAIARDGVVLVRATTHMVEAAREHTYPAAQEKTHTGRLRNADSWYGDAHPLSIQFFNCDASVFKTHFHAISMRRMAAIRLAIRLFEIEHGQLPLSLEELVPVYLPSVPQDPFAHDGRSMTYLPNNSPRLLYSIGPNGIDDAGRSEPERKRIEDTNLDVPLFLDGRDALGPYLP